MSCHIHDGGGPRIEGSCDRPHPGPWELGQDNDMPHSTYRGINGWEAFVGFTPTKQNGVVLLCSCDSRDADMNNLGFVLLHLTGTKNLTSKTGS